MRHDQADKGDHQGRRKMKRREAKGAECAEQAGEEHGGHAARAGDRFMHGGQDAEAMASGVLVFDHEVGSAAG